jgi:hypothetical protein
MKYLVDSDTLIRAKNDFYRFETAPGFWDCLESAHKRGLIFSVSAVRHELTGEDHLANWAKKMGTKFFLNPDSFVQSSLTKIAEWVGNHGTYSDAAKQDFLKKADFVLAGHAHAYSYTVVTFEKHAESKHVIKIPSVCKQFAVKCVPLFAITTELGLNLVQGPGKPS